MPRQSWSTVTLACAALLGSCGPQGAAPPADPAPNPLVVRIPRPERKLDALGMFAPAPAAARVPAPAPLPELDFVELSEGLPPSGTWAGRPLLFDFTGNGRTDLVASNCEEAEGYGAWAAPTGPGRLWEQRISGLPRGLGCGPACAVDLDRDGHADLVLSSLAHGLRVFLGDGQLGWRESSAAAVDCPALADLALGNLDGDGLPDLVGIGYPSGGLVVLLGSGHGTLQAIPGPAGLSPEEFGRDVELCDLDGNGRDDIIVATSRGLRVFLTLPTTPPTWRELSQGLPAPRVPDSITSVCAGRFTADPHPEIAVCSLPDTSLEPAQRDSIGVYAYVAAHERWEHVDSGLPRSERYNDLRAADFDGDSKLDLLVLSLERGAAIYLGDGLGGFRPKGRLRGVHGLGRIAIGQVDDGPLPDVVLSTPGSFENPQAGGVRAFLNRRAIWD